ncbi:MAG: hypothetical protein KDD38_00885 [Bdellovibrionales bacterium]|nr:hypothetical protein [Bdellovibrionales bacterium]
MCVVRCVKYHVIVVFAVAGVSLAALASSTLPAPAPKKAQDFNYTNGDVGSNALGLSAADAADIDEENIALAVPKLKPADIATDPEATVLDAQKNSEKCLNSCSE